MSIFDDFTQNEIEQLLKPDIVQAYRTIYETVSPEVGRIMFFVMMKPHGRRSIGVDLTTSQIDELREIVDETFFTRKTDGFTYGGNDKQGYEIHRDCRQLLEQAEILEGLGNE